MFANEEHQRREGTGAGSNKTLLQHGFDLEFNLLFLIMRVLVGAHINRGSLQK